MKETNGWFDMANDDEMDDEEVDLDEDQRPPVVAPPGVTPPAAPVSSAPPVAAAPWSAIGTAAGQLRAGQPVTALPRQPAWSGQDWAAWQQRQAAPQERMRAMQEQRELAQTLQANQAANKSLKAIQASVQFLGLRRYQNDLAAGIPTEKAIARNAPLMFWTHPASIVPAIRAAQPRAEAFVPQPLNVPGMPPAIRSGRYGERVQFAPQPRAQRPVVEGKLTDVEKLQYHEDAKRVDDLEKRIRLFEGAPKLTQQNKDAVAAWKAEMATANARLDALRHKGQAPVTPAPAAPASKESLAPGQLVHGNIDLTERPRVRNPDRTISTVRSISIEEDGKEVLIPTVSDDGKVLSDKDAINLYRRTRKHLGIFKDPDSATAYARQLHESQAASLSGKPPNAPANPKERVTGQVYTTPKGVHRWTGKGWATVE